MYDISMLTTLVTTLVTIGHNHNNNESIYIAIITSQYNNYLDTIDAAAVADRELSITVTHLYNQALFTIRTAYLVYTLDYSAN